MLPTSINSFKIHYNYIIIVFLSIGLLLANFCPLPRPNPPMRDFCSIFRPRENPQLLPTIMPPRVRTPGIGG